jgi:hypothetical protein
VHGHHPAPRHEAVDLDELDAPVVSRRRKGGDMDVRLAILEVRTLRPVCKPVSCVPVQIERLGEFLGTTVERLIEVDPHDGGAAQVVNVRGPVRDVFDGVAMEQQRLHCRR